MGKPKPVHLAAHTLIPTNAVACGSDKRCRRPMGLVSDERPVTVTCRNCKRTHEFKGRFIIHETAKP